MSPWYAVRHLAPFGTWRILARGAVRDFAPFQLCGPPPVLWTPSLRRLGLQAAFKVGGAQEAEARVPPRAVVPELDVLEHRRARLVARRPVAAVGQLSLERREEALGHRVVPAVPRAAHAARHLVHREQRLVRRRRVLTAAVTVMNRPRPRAPRPQRHDERVPR